MADDSWQEAAQKLASQLLAPTKISDLAAEMNRAFLASTKINKLTADVEGAAWRQATGRLTQLAAEMSAPTEQMRRLMAEAAKPTLLMQKLNEDTRRLMEEAARPSRMLAEQNAELQRIMREANKPLMTSLATQVAALQPMFRLPPVDLAATRTLASWAMTMSEAHAQSWVKPIVIEPPAELIDQYTPAEIRAALGWLIVAMLLGMRLMSTVRPGASDQLKETLQILFDMAALFAVIPKRDD